jgi:hypothetical protein
MLKANPDMTFFRANIGSSFRLLSELDDEEQSSDSELRSYSTSDPVSGGGIYDGNVIESPFVRFRFDVRAFDCSSL